MGEEEKKAVDQLPRLRGFLTSEFWLIVIVIFATELHIEDLNKIEGYYPLLVAIIYAILRTALKVVVLR